MPLSYATYTGNGSATTFSVPFPYLLKAHVKLYIGLNILEGTYSSLLVEGTNYTWSSATQVQLTTAPTASQVLTIIRDTPDSAQLVPWQDGSNLIAGDLNTADLQNLYVVQEQQDRNDLSATASLAATAAVAQAILADGTRAMTANLSLGGFKATNLAAPTLAADAVTKAYNDAFINQTANLADGCVTSAKIADGTIVAGDIAADAITTAKILDGNVTTAKIADGNVTTAKVADSAITSAKIADGTIVTADLANDAVTTAKIVDANVTTAKIVDSGVTTAKIADGNVTTAKILDGNVTTGKLADSSVTTGKLADGNVTTAKILDGNVTTAKINDQAVTAAKIADGVIDSTKLTGGTVVTNAEVSGVTVNDTSFFTTSASDLRYFRQDSSETITSGVAWSGSDSFIATTAAIDARIVDLVDDIGGFVPIANETSFPATNPDINSPDGAGTIISVSSIATTRTPAGGTVTIPNGSGANTVTITGCGSTVLAAGYGLLVETTATLHTYTFHRLVPRATEVTTVANNAAAIATAATNVADINNFADVYQIGATEPTQRADTTALQQGDLWFDTQNDVIQAYDGADYAPISPTQAVLNDIAVVANDLSSFDDLGFVSDALLPNQTGGALETCSDNIADINTVADQIAPTNNVGTVAGVAASVSTVAGIASNVTTVATNNANVTTVAGINGSVSTVAGISSNVSTVAGISSNVSTVAGISSNVTTVATNNANVSTVAGQISPTNNLGTVAGIAANVSTVAGISGNVTTVAGVSSNVTTVANSIADVNTVAGSIADVNRYAQEYKISNTQPASPVAGDLWYDGTNNVLKFFNGTIFASISAGITQLQDDTSPDLGGNLNAGGFNINSVGTIDGTNLTIDFGTL